MKFECKVESRNVEKYRLKYLIFSGMVVLVAICVRKLP